MNGSARALLVSAAQTWEDTTVSEQYVQQALAQPDVDLDVLVSAYRYYFYKNNNAKALAMAIEVCDRIAKSWPSDWETLKPLLIAQLDSPAVRLYLSAYAASGLLIARLGQLENAQRIAAQIQQIEAKEFGGELLFSILNAADDED
ncbi:MAG: hypothetical protein AAGI69_02225 [Cyanobacteria bacterium P01_H01_bin.21]